MIDEKETKHPSFGMVNWSRVNGQRNNLFMSSLEHSGWVELTIRTASAIRRGYDTYASGSGGRPLVRVAMTEAQFASFITTPNQGDGTPCTITRKDNEGVEQCPPDEQMVQFRQELHENANSGLDEAHQVLKDLETLLSGKTVKKGDLKEVKERMEKVIRTLDDSTPYVVERFNEYMDGVFHDAVARFEGHIKTRTEYLGLEALQNGPRALGSEET